MLWAEKKTLPVICPNCGGIFDIDINKHKEGDSIICPKCETTLTIKTITQYGVEVKKENDMEMEETEIGEYNDYYDEDDI